MKNAKLPAGLENADLEVYVFEGALKGTYNGRRYDFIDLPQEIIACFEADYIRNKVARKSIKEDMCITDSWEQLEQYVMCNYGGFNLLPDYSDGDLIKEYWDCGRHGDCPAEGKACQLPSGPHGKLAPMEAKITRLIATGKLDKEIADICNHEVTTTRTHIKRIFKKLGVNNRVEACRWAEDNMLL